MKKNRLCLAGALCLLVANGFADTWSVGGMVLLSPSPYKNTSTKFLPLPTVGLKSRYWAIKGPGLSFLAKNDKSGKFGAYIYMGGRVFEAKKSTNAAMKKLNNRKRLFYFGPFASLRTRIGSFAMRLGADVSGVTHGAMARVSYGFPIFLFKARLMMVSSVGATWLDSNIANHFYGVSQAEHKVSGLSAYQLKHIWLPFYSVFVRYKITPKHWRIQASAKLYMLPHVVRRSPMVDASVDVGSMVAISYAF